jgi:hypothetical protein
MERSGTFLEIKDANGRAFRYVSLKECPSESQRWGNGNVEVRRIDEAFCNMVEVCRTKARLTERCEIHHVCAFSIKGVFCCVLLFRRKTQEFSSFFCIKKRKGFSFVKFLISFIIVYFKKEKGCL